MTDANTIFNTSGKIPTLSQFWAQDSDKFMSESGITPYFRKVLGEQVFAPLKIPQIAFYKMFAGRPIEEGAGWEERIIKKKAAVKFDPKASASDDIGFYDSGGYEFEYGIDVKGRMSVSLPSDLESIEMFLKKEGAGELNSRLVDSMILDYQRNIESEIQMKLITTCKNHVEVNPDDHVGIVKKINEIIVQMRGNSIHLNDVTTYKSTGETINDNIYTNSEKVYVFIYAGLLKKIQESLAGYPSPDKIFIDAEVISLVDPLPAALTTAQWNAGKTAHGWDATVTPSALDTAAPLAFVCSSRRCEYRPVIGGYKMNLSRNGAGDFTNQHLIWKGGIGVRPYENAVRIMGDSTITTVDGIPVKVVNEVSAEIVNDATDPVPTSGTITVGNTTSNPVPTHEVAP